MSNPSIEVRNADVGLERNGFLRSLLRELSGTLPDVVGLDEAAGPGEQEYFRS